MIRRFLLLYFLAIASLCSPLRAESGWEVTGDHTAVNMDTGDGVYTGHPRLIQGNLLITADELRFNFKTKIAIARGHVALTRGPQRVLADEIIYYIDTRRFEVKHARVGEFPFYLSGVSVSGTKDRMTVGGATVEYREPGFLAPTVHADSLLFLTGEKIQAQHARFGLGESLPVHLPKFEQSLKDSVVSYLHLIVGYRSSLGEFLGVGATLPLYPDLKAGAEIDYFTKRGAMVGPTGVYHSGSGDQEIVGSLRSGYINDFGKRLTDVLDRPISANRGFITWRHQQYFNEHLSLVAKLDYWSDSEILRDFRPDEFFEVQTPDSYVEAQYKGDNYYVSVFARPQPNPYNRVQERLPEVRFDLLPTPIGLGLYERFNSGVAVLRENPPNGGTTLRSNRFDAFYEIYRPIIPSEWLSLTPVAGGRLTEYARATGGKDSYTRLLGELGFDGELRTSGVYQYKNDAWQIDGIRHLLTPKISYRYIPAAEKGTAYIPPIDATVFQTYLEPLELGDRRNIDQLTSSNTLRLGIDNTFQTRDKNYGSRDLLVFNLAADLRLDRNPGEEKLSEIHNEVIFTPARWLRVDLYNSFYSRDFTLREFNSGITFLDGKDWSLRLGNHYLKDQIEEYTLRGSYRLNESYEAYVNLHYDTPSHRFVEQTVGIRQNLRNLWFIQYGVSFYNGRTRESNFGFSIDIKLAGF